MLKPKHFFTLNRIKNDILEVKVVILKKTTLNYHYVHCTCDNSLTHFFPNLKDFHILYFLKLSYLFIY